MLIQTITTLTGGKVFVFTGLFPVVENRDGLAIVLGHEIAHVVCRKAARGISFPPSYMSKRVL